MNVQQKFLKNVIPHIGYNNTIITDLWQSYNWLEQNGYHHLVHAC